MARIVRVDGAFGEGGGQIVRSSVAIAAVRGVATEIVNIRARRPNRGLQAQHLTAVRAAAALCGAELAGDWLGSERLLFAPRHAVAAGRYAFDVAEARAGGSAGSAALVLQTVALPLLLARGRPIVVVEGGTHLPASPCFDYLERVWAPALSALGLKVGLVLESYGFYPRGGGRIRAELEGNGPPRSLERLHRGALSTVEVRAIAASLPAHIAQRMADRARSLLAKEGIAAAVEPRRVRAASPGAVTFVAACYEGGYGGFTGFGAPGKPSEQVAEEAVTLFRAHQQSGAALDRWLADQILLPLAFARGSSRFTTDCATAHLHTQAELLRLFGLAAVRIKSEEKTVAVQVEPAEGGA